MKPARPLPSAVAMRVTHRLGNWAGLVGGSILLLNFTALWEPNVHASWGAVMIGIILVLAKGVAAWLGAVYEAELAARE